jgi:hypothetical protein
MVLRLVKHVAKQVAAAAKQEVNGSRSFSVAYALSLPSLSLMTQGGTLWVPCQQPHSCQFPSMRDHLLTDSEMAWRTEYTQPLHWPWLPCSLHRA